MENVGESVKKFCSEVMQDLLLPDSLEVADSNLALDKHDNVKLCEKPLVGLVEEPIIGIKDGPKVSFKVEPMKFDRLVEPSGIADMNGNMEHKSSFVGLYAVNSSPLSHPGKSVDAGSHAGTDLHLVQNDNRVMCKNLDAGIEVNPVEVRSKVSGIITSVSSDVSKLPSSLSENCEIKCNQIEISSCRAPVEITECNLEVSTCNEIADLTPISTDLQSVPLVESIRKDGREMVFSSGGRLSSESNGDYFLSSCHFLFFFLSLFFYFLPHFPPCFS